MRLLKVPRVRKWLTFRRLSMPNPIFNCIIELY